MMDKPLRLEHKIAFDDYVLEAPKRRDMHKIETAYATMVAVIPRMIGSQTSQLRHKRRRNPHFHVQATTS